MEIIGPVYRRGDTDEETVVFPNGYLVNITFENDAYSEGSRFDSKCRRCVLKDSKGNIISEIIEKNPHNIPDDVRKSFFGW